MLPYVNWLSNVEYHFNSFRLCVKLELTPFFIPLHPDSSPRIQNQHPPSFFTFYQRHVALVTNTFLKFLDVFLKVVTSTLFPITNTGNVCATNRVITNNFVQFACLTSYVTSLSVLLLYLPYRKRNELIILSLYVIIAPGVWSLKLFV